MSSILKVDTIQDQSGNNIINESGNVITIGASGDTITVPAGATVSGFTSAGIDDNATSVAITIDSSENVGIGTTAPGSELHVVADNVSESWSPYDGTVLTIENNDTDGCILQTVGRNTATNEIWFGDDDSRNIGRIRYEHSNDGLEFWTNSSERMRIDASGNVGIGTSSPSTSLHISQSVPIITLTDTDTSVSHQLSGQSGSRHLNLKVDTGGSSGSPVFNLSMQDSIKLSVLNDGNVGIGTTSPGTRLSFGNYIPSNGQTIHTYQSGNTVSGLGIVSSVHRMFTNSGSSMSFGHVSTSDGSTYSEAMRITSSGKVGIGTTSPNRMLTVEGDGGEPDISLVNLDNTNNNFNQIRFLSVGSDDSTRRLGADIKALYTSHSTANPTTNLVFGTASGSSASTERMRIDSSGNVGIGTSSPGTKLDVVGTVKATGFDGSTPIVYAQGNSSTSCANNTATKITLDNEIIDTEGLFANSRFTVTSGYEGKYLIIFQLSFNHTATSKAINPTIKVNNTTVAYGQDTSAKSSNHTMTVRTSIITDLSVNDYVEFFGRQDSGSTKTTNSGIYTNASITKLID